MVAALNATKYPFQGEGITASYFPHGAGGLLRADLPVPFFTYQDHHMSKAFGDQDVDVKQIENVGALISVALVKEGGFALGGGAITTCQILPGRGHSELVGTWPSIGGRCQPPLSLLRARLPQAAHRLAARSGVHRVPHPSRPGKRRTRVWTVDATTNAVLELAGRLVAERAGKVALEATSDYWRICFCLLESPGWTCS